jgi:NADH-quinone oxidoreductase subunit E
MDDIVARLADINNRFGFISREQVELLAKELKLTPAKVFGAATFYSMFRTQPRGKHIIRFCEDAPCHVAGGREVFDAIRAALGLEPGQTSADGKWTFEMTSCLGVCGVAPVMLVDDTVYGNLTPEKVTQLLATVEQSISN